MKEGTRNLLVGVFVLAALGVLGMLMVWFGETPSWLGGNEWCLRITGVRALSGIGDGSPVSLNGVEIGRVKRLEFEDPNRPDQGVVIITGIWNRYSVPKGSLARVYGATLGFGTGHVDIVVEPGLPAEPLDKESAEIRGEMRSIIGELISKDLVTSVEQTIAHLGKLAEAAKPVAENLAELLEQRSVESVTAPDAAARGVTANLSTVIERVDNLAANVNAVLGDQDVQGDVRAAVSDLKSATEELRQTIGLWRTESQRISDSVNTRIDRTGEDLDQTFAKLNRVLDNLDATTTSMASLMYRVHEGEGTAGLFVRDERLYEAAVLTMERFGELLDTLQRVAGKIEQDGYITIGQRTPFGTFKEEFPVGPSTVEAAEPP